MQNFSKRALASPLKPIMCPLSLRLLRSCDTDEESWNIFEKVMLKKFRLSEPQVERFLEFSEQTKSQPNHGLSISKACPSLVSGTTLKAKAHGLSVLEASLIFIYSTNTNCHNKPVAAKRAQ